MRVPVRAVAAAALLALATSGCGAPTEPARVAGVFVLERVGSMPLPAVWVENEHVRVEVLADTIWLYEGGTGVQHVTRRVALPGGETQTNPDQHRFTYAIAGDRIEISIECVDVVIRAASCVAPPHAVGEVLDGGMRLFTFEDHEVLYRRL